MAKILNNFPTYSQRIKLAGNQGFQADGNLEKLCATWGDFQNYGCGICCAAMITQYKEGGIKDPSVMQQRGVWNRSNLSTQWHNASSQFRWGGQEYDYNLTGALREIKNQIDRYNDPVVLRIANNSESFKHFVVVYGYHNNCTSAQDVLIKDPYNYCSTLSQAMTTWPVFKFLKRVI